MAELEKIEQLLVECEKDLKQLKAFRKEFRAMERRLKELEDYYTNQYLEDYEKHSETRTDLRILDQDSIWNVLSGEYSERVALLKQIVKNM